MVQAVAYAQRTLYNCTAWAEGKGGDLTTLSVASSRWVIDDESRVGKDLSGSDCVLTDVLSQHRSGETVGKPCETSVRMVGVPAGIRTQNLPITKQQL